MKMRIARGFSLDSEDFVTMTQVILAQKGKGKSHLAQVEAEELLRAEHQVLAIDPTGAWWGLRSSKDGKSRGYPIVVIGGEHADVPLEATAGEIIAEAIATEHFSAIIDTSLLRKNESLRFMAAFLETLYRKNREALHLFIDEADVVAPQKTFSPEQARCLGAAEDIVRRGRIRGIGCTMISQRPQVINKDVLSQADMLTTLGMNHPKDLGAIDAWIAVHGDAQLAETMIETLPAMPRGQAWVWSPSMEIFERVSVRDKTTFDSGRTPKAGERRVTPKVLADVDIKKLGKSIAETVERAKSTDPRLMRQEIERLRAELEARPTTSVEAKPSKGAAKALASYERATKAWSRTFDRYTEKLKSAADSMRALLDRGDGQLEAYRAESGLVMRTLEKALAPTVISVRQNDRPTPARSPRKRPDTINPGAPGTNTVGLPSGEETILRALIQYPQGLTSSQIAVICGYAKRTRDAYLQRLESRGYVERSRGSATATTVGRAALPDAQPLPRGAALRDWWFKELPSGEGAILAILIDAYPKAVDNDEIDTRTGFAKRTRDAYLQRMDARGVVDRGRGNAKASAVLFE